MAACSPMTWRGASSAASKRRRRSHQMRWKAPEVLPSRTMGITRPDWCGKRLKGCAAKRGSAATPAMGVGFSSLIVSLGQYNRTKPRRPTAFPRFWREANSAKNLTRAEGTRAPDTLSVEVFGEDLPEEREEPAPVRRGCHPPRLAPHRLGRLRHGHAQTRRADHLEIILLVAHRDDVRERHAEMVGDHAEGRALGGGGRNHLEVVSPGHDEPRLLAHRPRQVVADDGKRLGMADEQGLDEPAHAEEVGGLVDDFQGHRLLFRVEAGRPALVETVQLVGSIEKRGHGRGSEELVGPDDEPARPGGGPEG